MADGYYFNYLPTISYETFDGSGQYKIVTDIFNRVRVTLEARQDKAIYYKYTVRDKETPEAVSYKYYGQPQYYWVILLMNELRDPQWGWPLNMKQFDSYLISKYGSVDAPTQTISHYETLEIKAPVTDDNYTAGDVIMKSGMFANASVDYSYTTYNDGVAGDTKTFLAANRLKSFTVYEKEEKDNENKREILLLRRDYLYEFVDEFEKLVVRRV